MRTIAVISVLVAVCASSVIPPNVKVVDVEDVVEVDSFDYEAITSIPGDNSHYVEGKSRYIWMPDGDGVPHLVDLHMPVENSTSSRNGANNQYWLYTRRNPNNAQIIVHNNANTIWSSNYVASRPLMFVVHGWNSDGNSALNPLITSAFLAAHDGNVIVVDWRGVANNINYIAAANGVPNVGQFIGDFLVWLINTTGTNWNNVHLVGFSLGAHAVGIAGRRAGGRPVRVTGLDPAGPTWGGNSQALNSAAGTYVEAIHTDGGILGIFDRVGNCDFYPNRGRNPQPGCSMSTCSHSRAWELFASSIRTNHFVGRQCSNLNQAQNNQCSGSTLSMGNSILSKRGNGIYGLTTGNSWPF